MVFSIFVMQVPDLSFGAEATPSKKADWNKHNHSHRTRCKSDCLLILRLFVLERLVDLDDWLLGLLPPLSVL